MRSSHSMPASAWLGAPPLVRYRLTLPGLHAHVRRTLNVTSPFGLAHMSLPWLAIRRAKRSAALKILYISPETADAPNEDAERILLHSVRPISHSGYHSPNVQYSQT